MEQLRALIGEAAAKHRPDKETARRVAALTVSERITEDTLAALQSRAAGADTAIALTELADQSAFLDPPAQELSADAEPTLAERKQMLDRAVSYAVEYAKRLPNLMCREQIRRFDNDPSALAGSERLGDLTLKDTIVAQIAYSHGEEQPIIKAINETSYAKTAAILGVTTSGEFGSTLIAPFHPNSHAKASWSHWETLHGKKVAVLRYAVLAENSRYDVAYCCERGKAKSVTSAFHGFLFLDPSTGAVVRITRSSEGLPADFQTRQVDTEVEYGPVTIGEQSFMCPIRSVTKVVNHIPRSARANTELLVSLNITRYSQYREFQAEGRLVATARPGTTAQPAAVLPSTPETSAIEPQAPVTITPPEAPDTGAATEPEPTTLDALFSIPKLPPYREAPSSENNVPLVPAIPTFREQVRLVRVPVVVRDSQGASVANLTRDQFEILDNGKRQTISSFEVRRPTSRAETRQSNAASESGVVAAVASRSPDMPTRYLAFLFDDLHLKAADLSQTRAAAERTLSETLGPGTRVAIFTTSETNMVDFTADRERIVSTLKKITATPLAHPHFSCPDVGYMEADLIVNRGDRGALGDATRKAMLECGIAEDNPDGARSAALSAARQSLTLHDNDVQRTVDAFRVAVRSLEIRPGERRMILISPGFFSSLTAPTFAFIEDRAVRGGVVVDALNAEGLATAAGVEADEQYSDRFVREQHRQQSNVLVDLADATGGKVFENSNDYDAGFQRLATVPEYVYVLGFSPAAEKPDGRYHRLTVRVSSSKKFEVRARRAYLSSDEAPADPAREAREEIQTALFSREEMKEIPAAVKLSFKPEPSAEAQVTVDTHVDLTQVALQEASGHFRDTLTLAFGFFDANGSLTFAQQQEFALDIPKEDLTSRLQTGVDLRSHLKMGKSDFLRVILRDVNGRMSTLNEVLAR